MILIISSVEGVGGGETVFSCWEKAICIQLNDSSIDTHKHRIVPVILSLYFLFPFCKYEQLVVSLFDLKIMEKLSLINQQKHFIAVELDPLHQSEEE